MKKPNVIYIEISGSVQIGKSAVLQSIKGMLEGFNYCVVVPDRAERHNPSKCISKSASHEQPSQDNTVIILSESVVKL